MGVSFRGRTLRARSVSTMSKKPGDEIVLALEMGEEGPLAQARRLGYVRHLAVVDTLFGHEQKALVQKAFSGLDPFAGALVVVFLG